MGLLKNKKPIQEEKVKTPYFILINRKKNTVWHETFTTRAMAQGMIDHAKNKGLSVDGWEIEEW